MEELLKFLNERIERGVELVNLNYKNDVELSCQDWTKGSLSAYSEVRYFVEGKLKKQDYNDTDATETRQE